MPRSPRARFALLTVTASAGLLWAANGLLTSGTPSLDTAEVLDLLFSGGGDERTRLVVLELRLPRLVLALLGGVAFGTSGWVLQEALQNPLAGPELLGVGGGASLAVATVVFLGANVPPSALPIAALVGGLGAGSVVLFTAPRRSHATSVVLVGAAVSLLAWAGVTVLVSLAARSSDVALFFQYTVGSLANRRWSHVRVAFPWVMVGFPIALALGRVLDVLALGEGTAGGLGLDVARARFGFMAVSAALLGGIVAVAGPISWVALLSPHLARAVVGRRSSRSMMLVSALLGATILVVADNVARSAIGSIETPVGLWTALVGGPAVLWIVRRGRVGFAS